MINTLILAATLAVGSCPKPTPHHVHHHKPVPLCTCVDEAPQPTWFPVPAIPEELLPIEINVHRYYVLIGENVVEFETFDWDPNYYAAWGWGAHGGIGGEVRKTTKAPEIDPNSAGAALTLLVGGLAVVRGRKS